MSRVFTKEDILKIIHDEPEADSLPEFWDFYVFSLEILAYMPLPAGFEPILSDYIKHARETRDAYWQLWLKIKGEAEEKTGSKVIPAEESLLNKPGLTRAYVDSIFLDAIKTGSKGELKDAK